MGMLLNNSDYSMELGDITGAAYTTQNICPFCNKPYLERSTGWGCTHIFCTNKKERCQFEIIDEYKETFVTEHQTVVEQINEIYELIKKTNGIRYDLIQLNWPANKTNLNKTHDDLYNFMQQFDIPEALNYKSKDSIYFRFDSYRGAYEIKRSLDCKLTKIGDFDDYHNQFKKYQSGIYTTTNKKQLIDLYNKFMNTQLTNSILTAYLVNFLNNN